MAQQPDSIKSYTNDDVDKVLKSTFENVLVDREKTQGFIDGIKDQIEKNPMDAIFLLDKAIALLDVQSKQTDILVKLAGVMQRLQANVIVQMKQESLAKGDFASLMQEAEKLKLDTTKKEQ